MTRDDLQARILYAIDRVHDMDVTHDDYARSVADDLWPMVEALHLYRLDMRHVPLPVRRARRIAMVDALLGEGA